MIGRIIFLHITRTFKVCRVYKDFTNLKLMHYILVPCNPDVTVKIPAKTSKESLDSKSKNPNIQLIPNNTNKLKEKNMLFPVVNRETCVEENTSFKLK